MFYRIKKISWDSTYLSALFLVRVVQMCCIAKEDPHGIVQLVQPVGSYFLGCDADAPLSQEMIFDFRGADLHLSQRADFLLEGLQMWP